DEIWRSKPGGYERIVFVGHSLGGILLRRLFLAGSLNPDDYAGEFSARDELSKRLEEQRQTARKRNELPELKEAEVFPCEWAPKVERLILLATWDKGWSVSPRTSWWTSIGLNALAIVGRLTELAEPVLGHADEGARSEQNVPQAPQRPGLREHLAKARDNLAK